MAADDAYGASATQPISPTPLKQPTLFDEALRPIESGKIKCGKAHFQSIDSRMIVAHTIDDVHELV